MSFSLSRGYAGEGVLFTRRVLTGGVVSPRRVSLCDLAGRFVVFSPIMAAIVLCTFNARYIHAAFGLRYLMANLGDLAKQAAIVEFDVQQRTVDAAEAILAHHPEIVGIGVYIWNATVSAQLVAELRRLRPGLCIVLGGPEVSYETDQQEICRLADYVICGEADLAFRELCEKVLAGRRPLQRIIQAEPPHFDGEHSLALPYPYYDSVDVKNRVIYVEASRGCPFKCEFCLSSLDVPVRNVPVEPF